MGRRELHVAGGRRLPVLSLRVRDECRAAAAMLVVGHPAAFYIGLFTVVRLLGPPWTGDARLFWTVKPGRPSWSKLPMVALPRHALRLADLDRTHRAFRGLAARERWEGLWRSVGAPLHVIAPVRRPARFVHGAFVTEPADRGLDTATAAFFWFDDPDWRDLAEEVGRRARPRRFLAGTSFNESGAQPPYTLSELGEALATGPGVPVDLVVTDEVLEEAGVFSSHTMVRLPLPDEPPALLLEREGSVGESWLSEATGWPVRRVSTTATASRRPGLSVADVEARARRLARRVA